MSSGSFINSSSRFTFCSEFNKFNREVSRLGVYVNLVLKLITGFPVRPLLEVMIITPFAARAP